MKSALRMGAAIVALGASVATVSAQEPVTLEYWVYADFARGEALAMQQEFIKEFEASHPGVKINISGKSDDDLTTGLITAASSKTLPDVFINASAYGNTLVKVGAMNNLYADFMALPQEYRDSLDPALIAICTPEPQTMYCLPYTGYATFMFRNLTVLEQAGIDTSRPPKDWAEWLDQMAKVKEKGGYGIPDMTQSWYTVAEIYSGTAPGEAWGVDVASNKTKVTPEKFSEALQMFVDLKPFSTGTSRSDQATTDLFVGNQLAFHPSGPWQNPTYVEAAKNGLKYDFVLMPGKTEPGHSSTRGYEIIGVAPNANAKVATEFAVYLTEKEQMLRWAKLLSRYNGSTAAMSDPSVAGDKLLAITNEAAQVALDLTRPYFLANLPNCYTQILTDTAQSAADGQVTPTDGGAQIVSELDDCLASN